jgi:hypothetical protein
MQIMMAIMMYAPGLRPATLLRATKVTSGQAFINDGKGNFVKILRRTSWSINRNVKRLFDKDGASICFERQGNTELNIYRQYQVLFLEMIQKKGKRAQIYSGNSCKRVAKCGVWYAMPSGAITTTIAGPI